MGCEAGRDGGWLFGFDLIPSSFLFCSLKVKLFIHKTQILSFCSTNVSLLVVGCGHKTTQWLEGGITDYIASTLLPLPLAPSDFAARQHVWSGAAFVAGRKRVYLFIYLFILLRNAFYSERAKWKRIKL